MSLQTDVAAYWAELAGPIPYVSTSHVTLARLVRQYGQDAVDGELRKLIEAERAECARRERARVRAFYASYGLPDPNPEE